MRDARLRQPPNKFQLGVQWDRALFILQTVSGPDFDYSHMVGGAAARGGERAIIAFGGAAASAPACVKL